MLRCFQVQLLICLSLALPVCAQTSNAIIYADLNTNLTYQQMIDSPTLCPSPVGVSTPGCTIYATSPNASKSLGTIDPASSGTQKTVTLYLGPFTYTVDHIVMRSGLRIIGTGAAWNSNTGTQGTRLQSTNTSNFPMFKLPQTGDVNPNSQSTDIYFYGFVLLGAANNTSQSGIWADCSQFNSLSNGGAGLMNSSFEDLWFFGFAGDAIGLFGPSNEPGGHVYSANQFLSFRNIRAFRPTPQSGPDLRMEGSDGQIDCINCLLDGAGQAGDGWANVYIGNTGGGNLTPYSIHFFNLTSQSANVAVQIQGAKHLTFVGSHHEALNGGYLLSTESPNANKNILLSNPFFAGNVGTVSGGYIINANNATKIALQNPEVDGVFNIIGTSAGNVVVY
ncbi:MAG: hypothetical protein WCE73_24760 [Candidatus Angelobacter sp.]